MKSFFHFSLHFLSAFNLVCCRKEQFFYSKKTQTQVGFSFMFLTLHDFYFLETDGIKLNFPQCPVTSSDTQHTPEFYYYLIWKGAVKLWLTARLYLNNKPNINKDVKECLRCSKLKGHFHLFLQLSASSQDFLLGLKYLISLGQVYLLISVQTERVFIFLTGNWKKAAHCKKSTCYQVISVYLKPETEIIHRRQLKSNDWFVDWQEVNRLCVSNN